MTQRPARIAKRPPSMSALRPRSMLFTLFGDYAHPRRRDVPLAGLVHAGEALGLSEAAVRSAVARLAREGWIVSRRDGGRSRYGLSASGRSLIEEGTQRIYEPRRRAWDGAWCMLTYTIPESKRAERDRIRKQLAWLGFGAMGGGTYLSARDVAPETIALVRKRGVHSYARVFSAKLVGPGEQADLVGQCWDLKDVAARYDAFVRHYEPLFKRDAALQRKGDLEDSQAFVTRFALTHDFRRFPFIDPDLPPRLLPAKWPGTRARAIFGAHNRLLRAGAFRFFDAIARPGFA